MSYHFSTVLSCSWDEARQKIESALKDEGFGILTEINVQATLKAKLGVDFRPYVILGACNPVFAHKALQSEKYIGTMLPCNVIMQQNDRGEVEVSAVDPVASMQAIENQQLALVAAEVREKLIRVVANL
ncbi:MAG: DUF302 domain-containing protein [Bacteroidales bacterium]|nr:DUF302 domain-containing protein [Bacteroidales bacterium]